MDKDILIGLALGLSITSIIFMLFIFKQNNQTQELPYKNVTSLTRDNQGRIIEITELPVRMTK